MQVVNITNSRKTKLSLKTFVFSSFIMLFFISFNSGLINNSFLSFSDEIFLLLSLLILGCFIIQDLINGKLKKIYLIFLVYISYQIINYFISPFDLKLGLVLAQSLINIKVFLVTFAVILIWKNNQTNIGIVQNTYYLFIGLFIIGMLLNFVLQESWHILTGNSETISYRYGFIRPVGWLGHAAQNGYFFAITFATLFLLYAKKSVISTGIFVKKFFVFTVIDFFMSFPLSVRKGMMMIIPFGFTAFNSVKGYKKLIFFFIGILFLGLFLFVIKDMQIFQDTTQNFKDITTAEDNSYIRGLIIFYGFNLFLEFFPFGVGNATFGTVMSNYNTLEVYNYVGLDLSWLTKEDGTLKGVYDSGLFSMLAENGFIGILLMFSFIYYFFKFNKERLDEYNYLIFKIITWFAILLSLTEPVWQNGMFTVIYVMNLLFIYTKNNIYRQNKKWIHHENTSNL